MKPLKNLLQNPRILKALFNLYPPYLGTGIRVRTISADFSEIVVEMPLRWYNRNYVGTHFGGSLYAMTDPFFMVMLMHLLGPDYIVWDKSSSIEFVSPGKRRMTARFHLDNHTLRQIREKTANGEKFLPVYEVAVTDPAGNVVARVRKELYIRRKPSRCWNRPQIECHRLQNG